MSSLRPRQLRGTPSATSTIRLAVLGALVICALAASAAPARAEVFGSISGIVSFSGAPGPYLGGIYVRAFPVAGGPMREVAVDGVTGYYSITDLQPGTYRLEFFDYYGQYAGEWYDDFVYDPTNPTPVVVGSGEAVTASATLGAAGTISGVLTDADGQPISGVSVYALWDKGDGTYITVSQGHSTLTDGSYSMPVPAGQFIVGFFDPQSRYPSEYYDNATDLTYATSVPVLPATDSGGIDAVLGIEMGSISGIVSFSGAPGPYLGGIYARAFPDAGGPIREVAVDAATGFFSITDLQPGTYRLQFFDYYNQYVSEWYDDLVFAATGTPIVLDPGETYTASGTLGLPGSISGALADAEGAPIEGVDVFALYDRGDGTYLTVSQGITTLANGSYKLAGLPPGEFVVGFYDEQARYPTEYFDNALDLADATRVPVTAGSDSGGINAVLGYELPAITELASTSHPDPQAWYSGDAPALTWAASSSGEIVGYSYTIDGTSTTVPDDVVDTTSSSASFAGLADGVWYFHVRAVDDWDGWSETAHLAVRIDTAAPSTGDDGGEGWYLEGGVVTITPADGDGSGVVSTDYTLDGVPGTGWGAEPIELPLIGDGEHTIVYSSVDAADNVQGDVTVVVRLDATAPNTSALALPSVWARRVLVSLSAEDETSRVDRDATTYRVDGGSARPYSTSFWMTLPGNHEIVFSVRDVAGNASQATVHALVDPSPPRIAISRPVQYASYTIGTPVRAAWQATDEVSGIATAAGTLPSGSLLDTWTLGIKTFTVTASDLAGNKVTETVTYRVVPRP